MLGTVFINPLPIKDFNDRVMAFALYEFSCVIGIAAASIYGLLDQKDNSKGDVIELIVASLLLGIVISSWNIVLLFVAVFTLTLIILDFKRSSKK